MYIDLTDGVETVIDPVTGEVLDLEDLDGLLESYARLDERCRLLNEKRREFARLLAEQTEGDSRTRYLRGERLRAKITLPGPSWDRRRLKALWAEDEFRAFRDELLRVEAVAVNVREWKKAQKTAGPPEWEEFRNAISLAELPPSGTPTVKVEGAGGRT